MKVCNRCGNSKKILHLMVYCEEKGTAQDCDICQKCVDELWKWMGFKKSWKRLL